MFRTHYDLPLQRDVTGRFLPWIIALMVYLAILALAGSMVLSQMAQRWDKGLGRHPDHPGPAPAHGTPTSHPHPGGAGSAACDPRHREGGAAEAGADGEPSGAWLGSGALSADLPVPALIDVTMSGGRIDVRGLAQRLRAAVPGVEVDDHAAWLKDVLAIARAVEMVALGVVALVGGAAVATVIFVSRAGLAIHGPVVELLHVMGAPDRYVARQFQSHVLGLAVRGGLAGTLLAAATLFALTRAGESFPPACCPTSA